MKDVLIAIRAYNEGKNLKRLIEQIFNLYKSAVVLVVDDCSTDNTEEIIKKLKTKYQNLIYIRHIKNLNMGAALLTELKVAKKFNKHLITLDGDLQHSPEDIKNFLEIDNYDIILGNRYLTKNKIPLSRKILHFLNTAFNFILSGILIRDIHNGFRAYNKRVLDIFIKNLYYFDGTYADNIAIIISKYKLKYKEVPVKVRYTEETIKKGQKVNKTFLKILFRSFLLRFSNERKLFSLAFLFFFLIFFLLWLLKLSLILILISLLFFLVLFVLFSYSLYFWKKNLQWKKKIVEMIIDSSIRKYLKI